MHRCLSLIIIHIRFPIFLNTVYIFLWVHLSCLFGPFSNQLMNPVSLILSIIFFMRKSLPCGCSFNLKNTACLIVHSQRVCAGIKSNPNSLLNFSSNGLASDHIKLCNIWQMEASFFGHFQPKSWLSQCSVIFAF